MSQDLLAKYDRRVPRYTSYPTAPQFAPRVRAADCLAWLGGLDPELESCQTAAIDGYIVEGHVPIAHIERLLAERPDIPGIALPGMPEGAPGMPGPKPDRLTLYTIEKQPRAFPAR